MIAIVRVAIGRAFVAVGCWGMLLGSCRDGLAMRPVDVAIETQPVFGALPCIDWGVGLVGSSHDTGRGGKGAVSG